MSERSGESGVGGQGTSVVAGERSVPVGAWLAALALFALLTAFGSRYGYHRDELYFIEAGRHPAWGYPDQPPLVPLLAAGWDLVTGGRLWAFRLLPAVASALVAPLTAATCALLGGTRRDRVWAAAVSAVMTVTVAVGHLFSTATFDLALTVAVVLLALRALDGGGRARWLAFGLAAGVAMQVQLLPGLILGCGLAALLILGPRAALRSPWPWMAAGVALILAAPYLIWQTAHGWPQLQIAASVAAGHSTSSVPRPLVIPFQLVMFGVFISPVLLAGIWTLARSAVLRERRWLALAFGLLLVVITVTGGKPYYASGMLPALLAAGVSPVRAWARSHARRSAAGLLLALHLAGTALICLPISPPGSGGYQVAVAANPDAGETVGWTRLDEQVAAVAASTRPEVVLTANYGEAGSLDRYRRDRGRLPPVYSGHNGYGDWGPPPARTTTVLAVGDFGTGQPSAWFDRCRALGAINTGVDNGEKGAPLTLCTGPRQPWPTLWPLIRHNG